jgi:hypothetical protein
MSFSSYEIEKGKVEKLKWVINEGIRVVPC